MIFAARQIKEKCLEQNTHLYITFVDLTNAFDFVSREGIMAHHDKMLMSWRLYCSDPPGLCLLVHVAESTKAWIIVIT